MGRSGARGTAAASASSAPARQTSATVIILAVSRVRGDPGRVSRHSAPRPSRANALTPNSRPAPEATSPGSSAISGHSSRAPAAASPGIAARATRPRRNGTERHTLARSIRSAARRSLCGSGRPAWSRASTRTCARAGRRCSQRASSTPAHQAAAPRTASCARPRPQAAHAPCAPSSVQATIGMVGALVQQPQQPALDREHDRRSHRRGRGHADRPLTERGGPSQFHRPAHGLGEQGRHQQPGQDDRLGRGNAAGPAAHPGGQGDQAERLHQPGQVQWGQQDRARGGQRWG